MKNNFPSFLLGLVLAYRGLPFVWHVSYIVLIVASFFVGKNF